MMECRRVAALLLVCSALCSEVTGAPSTDGKGSESECYSDGEVWLSGGSNPFEGTVTVCHEGQWRNICILTSVLNWNTKHGQVVCRSLNYSTTGVEITEFSRNVSVTETHVTYTCNGAEHNLTECISEESNFVCSKVGQLRCQVPDSYRVCNTGELRLVTGNAVTTSLGQGRVELCSEHGLWGTVCDDKWDSRDARVVCRELRFNGTGHEAVQDADQFGEGQASAAVLVTNVDCSGEETSIHNCSNSTDIRGCSHSEDAAVVCNINNYNEGGNRTTSQTCMICSAQLGLGISLAILAVITFMAVSAITIRVIVERRRKKRQMPVSVEGSEYTAMYAARHASIQLGDESLAKLKSELNTYYIDYEQVEIGESLGEGCFGTVHKGVCHLESGDIVVAIKTIKSGNNSQDFIAECVIMKDFDHRNILGLVGVSFDDTAGLPLVILPFMANGDLRKYLQSKQDFPHHTSITTFPEGIDLSVLLCMCRDVARGMDYLAAKKFVHRDLAARNCMVSEDMTVKVADFGLSRDIYSKDYYRMGTKKLLPVKWMAPECLNASVFTMKSDVWSYGVVCWEVFSLGSTPYPGVGNHEVLDYITAGRRLKIPKLCTQEIFHTIELCWGVSPEERPDFPHLVQVFESLVKSNSQQQQETSYHHYINVDVEPHDSDHPNHNGTVTTPS